MGGRLDATNAVIPLVSVVTPIALDHMRWLGKTVAEVAQEKAGIIKPSVPVVSAPQNPTAAEVIVRRAEELRCSLAFAQAAWDGAELGCGAGTKGKMRPWPLPHFALPASMFRMRPSQRACGMFVGQADFR